MFDMPASWDLFGQFYNRSDHKVQKVEKLSVLSHSEDIPLNEIIMQKYYSASRMQQVFTELPEKCRRARPRKDSANPLT